MYTRGLSSAFAALLFASLAGLAGCSDTYESTRYENPASDSDEDDAPPPAAAYDESLTFRNRTGLLVNNSAARYRFDVAALRDEDEAKAARVLYPSHAAHLAATPGAIPSVQTVGTYVKQLDDTVYAGVELAVQDGLASSIAAKRSLLEGTLAWLVANRSPAGDEAAAHVAAALRLGNARAEVPSALEPAIARATARFDADTSASKPQSFYDWSDQLRAIWRQDRFLQAPLAPEPACALAEAITADPGRKAHYEKLTSLYAKLTNPLRSSLVGRLGVPRSRCVDAGPAAFVARSSTPEADLFEELYPDGVPAGANLMQDLVAAIRSGRVDLAPRPEDGFYRYQQYALESLLITDRSEERAKIGFTGRYKKRLREAFETMLVQHRETHAKQTDGPMTVSAAPEPTRPSFRVEPLATVYVRHARSYVFLERALDATFGPELLDAGRAVSERGVEVDSLRARIRRARDLFYGLYLVSGQDIGLRAKLDAEGDPSEMQRPPLAAAADSWLTNASGDPVAAADVRVIVPIARLGGGRMKYWAVVGVRSTLASYAYLDDVTGMAPPRDPETEARIPLPTEQFLEVTSSDVPLSRAELRRLCDENPTLEAIQSALERR